MYPRWVDQVPQGPEESPTRFLEQLCEICQVFTPMDPDAPQKQ